MKQIVLKNMFLLNFKGIKNLHIEFDNYTDVFGANGTGKTTLADAFTWCLFGKDSIDRKDFEIKTIDPLTNKVIPEIDHEVTLELLIDNSVISIKRVLKEKWSKKRGSETAEFTGNVNELYWDGVPVNLTEFNKKVSEIVNELVFKMVTSPTYFMGLSWKEKRSILTQIVGEVSDIEIANGNEAYLNMLSQLTNNKTIEEYNAQLSASVKKAKEDLKLIPARIDEVFRSKPESKDFTGLEIQLQKLQLNYNNIEKKINDSNEFYNAEMAKERTLKSTINSLEITIDNFKEKAKNEANQRLQPDTTELNNLQSQLSVSQNTLSTYEQGVFNLEKNKTELETSLKEIQAKILSKRTEWQTESSKILTFNDNDFHCPTCKREFEKGDVESKKQALTETFNSNKNRVLESINTEGQNYAARQKQIETEITEIETRIENGKTKVEEAKIEIVKIEHKIKEVQSENSNTETQSFDVVYNSILSLNDDYKNAVSELETLLKQVPQTTSIIDNSSLVAEKTEVQTQIDAIKKQLNNKILIDNAEKRINELKDEELRLAQQIANVEKQQFVIESFIKDKIDRLENAINSKFKFIKFRMFEEQINGGLKETCEATVNGVPYSDINTASKINAGLDVINTLSEFYGVIAPIFIDNSESVHTLIDTDSQLIRLIVNENFKQLEVKTKELVA